MDITSIDTAHSQLQTQSGETVASLANLNTKLSTAVAAGDQQAREWQLDLREIALAVRAEQQQVEFLLQTLHDYVAHNAPQAVPPPYQQQPQQYQVPPPQQSQGGFFSRFTGGGRGGGIGQSLLQGAGFGAGIGAGESLINDIFN